MNVCASYYVLLFGGSFICGSTRALNGCAVVSGGQIKQAGAQACLKFGCRKPKRCVWRPGCGWYQRYCINTYLLDDRRPERVFAGRGRTRVGGGARTSGVGQHERWAGLRASPARASSI